jgi:hypothetical protein
MLVTIEFLTILYNKYNIKNKMSLENGSIEVVISDKCILLFTRIMMLENDINDL